MIDVFSNTSKDFSSKSIPDCSTPVLVAPVLTVEADDELDVEGVGEDERDGEEVDEAHEEEACLVL